MDERQIVTINMMHTCPMTTGNTPHVGGPIIGPGSTGVTLDGIPIALQGDKCVCAAGGQDVILQGCSGVTIDGIPIAVQGSPTAHGGTIPAGVPGAVIISKNTSVLEAGAEGEPAVYNLQWVKEEQIIRNSKIEKVVILVADTRNIPNGKEVTVKVHTPEQDGGSSMLTELKGIVQDNQVQVEWKVEQKEENENQTKAKVYFRPLPSWRGEFGFDWFRDGKDTKYGLKNEGDYKQIIESGYKDEKSDLTKEDAIAKMKAEYENFGDYYVPYLTLFSKTFVDELKAKQPNITLPKYEVTLQLIIELEEDINKLKWKYDDTLIVKKPLLDKSELKAGKTIKKQITITCKDDLGKDTPIEVYAFSKGKNKKLVGKLIVLQNNEDVRREEKIALVEVKTDVWNRKIKIEEENFKDEEIKKLCYSLYQSFIIPTLLRRNLDLSNEPKFQGRTSLNNIFLPPTPDNIKMDYGDVGEKYVVYGRLIPNRFTYRAARKAFFTEKANEDLKENEWFTVFKFGVECNPQEITDSTLGRAEDVGHRCAFMFTAEKDKNGNSNLIEDNYFVLSHEVLHGLWLVHTHRDEEKLFLGQVKNSYDDFIGDKYKIIFDRKTTTNIMSYAKEMYSLWYWQWCIINPKIKERCRK